MYHLNKQFQSIIIQTIPGPADFPQHTYVYNGQKQIWLLKFQLPDACLAQNECSVLLGFSSIWIVVRTTQNWCFARLIADAELGQVAPC